VQLEQRDFPAQQEPLVLKDFKEIRALLALREREQLVPPDQLAPLALMEVLEPQVQSVLPGLKERLEMSGLLAQLVLKVYRETLVLAQQALLVR
jgi:hypothetical protein